MFLKCSRGNFRMPKFCVSVSLRHPNTMLYLLANCGSLKSEVVTLYNLLAYLSVQEDRSDLKERTTIVH